MKALVRVVGSVVGAGLIAGSFFLWMLSNDGLGSETTMKTLAGSAFAVGLIILGAALASAGATPPGD